MAFGAPHRVHLELAQARVIVALDADLLGQDPAALKNARDFASRRDPDGRSEVRYMTFPWTVVS